MKILNAGFFGERWMYNKRSGVKKDECRIE